MVKRAPIVLFCLCTFFGAQAQQFQRFNKISGTGETRSELAVLDSGFVTMVQDFHNWNALVVREYDLAGDMVDSAHYDFGDFVDNGGDNLVKVPNSSDYIMAQSYDRSVMLIRFNRQWDTLYTRIYKFQDSLETNCYSVKIEEDSNFVFTGYAFRKDTRKVNLALVKFDLDFNVVWEAQMLDSLSYPGGYYGLNIFPLDSGYLVGGVASYIGGQLDHHGIYAFFNKQGILKWKNFVKGGEGVTALKFGKRSDGNFFYVGVKELDTTVFATIRPDNLLYGVFDIGGNVISQKTIGPFMDYFGVDGFTQLSNGNYVIGGSTLNRGRFVAHLFCFDEDGNTVWHHRYFYAYEREECLLENFKPAGNGLIAVGEVYDADRRFSNNGDKFQWLLSIDENGCIDPDSCGQYFNVPEVTIAPLIKLYPNPSDHQLKVELDNQTSDEWNFVVHDIAGNILHSTKVSANASSFTINTTRWKAGVYMLRVFNSKTLHVRRFVVQH